MASSQVRATTRACPSRDPGPDRTSNPATRSAPDMSEMKDELEQQIEEAETSDDAIRGIKYTMRMRATIIASSTLFEMLILMLIILNGVLLGVQTYEKFGPLTNQALDATQRVRILDRDTRGRARARETRG